MPKSDRAAREAETIELRERAALIVAAIERDQPGPYLDQLRAAVARCRSLRDLRALDRELRGAVAALSPSGRQELERVLESRFGAVASEGAGKDAALAARVWKRGRILNEREYRAVEAYADSLGSDPKHQEEYLALGALLDSFTAAPE